MGESFLCSFIFDHLGDRESRESTPFLRVPQGPSLFVQDTVGGCSIFLEKIWWGVIGPWKRCWGGRGVLLAVACKRHRKQKWKKKRKKRLLKI